jgi:hypothetical protein
MSMVRRLLFGCGAAAVVVYLAAVVLGGLLSPGYNHLSMAVSELIAAGAPNKLLLDALFTAYNVLLGVFAFVLVMSVRNEGRASATVGSWLVAAIAVLGIVMTLFFPMDARGSASTLDGTLHLVLAGALSLCTILAMVLVCMGLRARDAFWIYCAVSAVLTVVSGGLAAAAAATTHPLMGLAERVTIGIFLQWVFVYAVMLWREDAGR